MLAPTSSKREEEATSNNGSRLVTLTKYVETGSDIGQLVEAEMGGKCERLGIMGLHTCGDLAPSSINTFLQCPRAVMLCNVGCCYNHLSDKGFPMSDHLRSSRYQVMKFV